MNVVRLLVLGAMREKGALHGYAIRQVLEDWRVQMWTRLHSGSVYHSLQHMAKEGLISSQGHEPGHRGPGKALFSLTSSGEEEFLNLLRKALSSFDLVELSAGLALLDCLPEEGSALLVNTASRLTETADHLMKLAAITPRGTGVPRTHDLLVLWSENLRATAGSLQKILAEQ
ncbi:putative transcriptional regulator [Nitratireductor aquibiodomus RA22]|uniref:Putative transcriptional regulator n=1 Tax=Nitratireductor aquibiodomus RA22 TaxID=1189611 RepID=I5BQN3_9HYPH|nr:PadR family transcriptional regulator [Nitratireductor aquibiodomus]EIM71885.1 putative transcriptional regulator [Nitratireductor aquibiodomus RA22]